MEGFSIVVEADNLARIMHNALAFFPARSVVKTALLQFEPDCMIATGTDTYTVGRDWCPISEVEPNALFAGVELDHAGWKDIEAQARKDKGHVGRLVYTPGDALVYQPGGAKAERGVAQDLTGKAGTVMVAAGAHVTSSDLWSMCDDLLTRLENLEPETPDVLTFDPALFGRFSKVKLPATFDGEKVLDFLYQGQAEPMLAKVGPTFVGAIMPIDRKVYIQNQPEGQDALW